MGPESRQAKAIVITGGGTGGHLFPAVAVMEALQLAAPDLRLEFIGRDVQRDREEIERRGVSFTGLSLEGLKRRLTLRNVRALWLFAYGVWRCWRSMRAMPKGIVFGVGGYVSAPAMLAGKILGWKLTLHEQNTVPGLVNRMMAAWCGAVFTTYEATGVYLKDAPWVVTGFPLRKELPAAKESGSPPMNERPFLLVIGGSQGARAIVEKSMAACRLLGEKGIEFEALIQTGERNYEWAKTLEPLPNVRLTPFIHEMAEAYLKADMVVSRAGSGSLSEIACFGLPSILIPYPYASGNHQALNARCFAEAGAARVVEEAALTPEQLGNELSVLLSDRKARSDMGHKAGRLARDDAARTIAEHLLNLF